MDDMKKRESFVVYYNWVEMAREFNFSDSQYRMFFDIIFDYQAVGKPIEKTGDSLLDIALFTIKPQLDANLKKYLNGKKGGAPKGNSNAKKQPKTTKKQPKSTEDNQKQANDNVNVNDNANVLSINIDNNNKHEQSLKGSAQFVNKNAELRKKYGIDG